MIRRLCMLLFQGANPNLRHRKNGCTPIHLAHFCTIEDTNAADTIRALLAAGANVNDMGGEKCGRYPIYHAIQHQRVDSVQTLLDMGSRVTQQAVLIAIDVSNPQILEMLLLSGAECGKMLDSSQYWGEPLHRVLYSPLKSPKECYKQLLQLMIQSTVCRPIPGVTCDKRSSRQTNNHQSVIESELRNLAKDSTELTRYLYAFLLRNGLNPNETLRNYGKTLGEPDWLCSYFTTPASLKDLCVRELRSNLLVSGNVMFGAKKLKLPASIQSHVLLVNPY